MVKALLLGFLALVGLVGSAEAAWTVDISTVTTDITTVGVAILGLVALMFGFRIVRSMLGR